MVADVLDELLAGADGAAGPERAVRRRHGRADRRAGQPGRRAARRTRCPRPGRTGGPSGSATSHTGADLPRRAALDQVGRRRPGWPTAPGSCTGATRRPTAGSSPTRWAPASWCCTGSGTDAGRRRAGLVAAGRPRLDGRPLGGRRRPLAGADRSPGTDSRATVSARRIGAGADGAAGRSTTRRCRRRRAGRRAPRGRGGRRHAVPAHRAGRRAGPAGGRRSGRRRAPTGVEIVGRAPDGRAGRRRSRGARASSWSGRRMPRTGSRSSTGPATIVDWPEPAVPGRRWSRCTPGASVREVFLGTSSFTRRLGRSGSTIATPTGPDADAARTGRRRALPDADRASAGAARPADGTQRADDGAAPRRPARRAAADPALRVRRVRHPGAADVLGDVRRLGARPAGCWRWPTCAAAASSAPPGTEAGHAGPSSGCSTTCSAAPRR